MNLDEFKKEQASYLERLTYLNVVVLFQEIIDYLQESKDIETLELVHESERGAMFMEDQLYVNLTGPGYTNWNLEHIFAFFPSSYLTKHKDILFPPNNKIAFTKNSVLGDMLEKYTPLSLHMTYMKEMLNAEIAPNVPLRQKPNKI